jgi:hypothetical protein
MRTKRGASIIEALLGVSILSLTLLSVMTMYVAGAKSFNGNSVKIELSQKNALGLRWVTKSIRQAATLSISTDGKTLTYSLPKKKADADLLTGERELVDPIESDGVTRTFSVVNGALTDGGTRVFLKNIATVDPDPASSQYNQTYAPFTLTTIGSKRAITINLITARVVGGKNTYVRTKTSVMLRNAK